MKIAAFFIFHSCAMTRKQEIPGRTYLSWGQCADHPALYCKQSPCNHER